MTEPITNLCVLCTEKMVLDMVAGDDRVVGGIYLWYCRNAECPNFGIYQVGMSGIEET